jgi:AcrR family transcriptional regulator
MGRKPIVDADERIIAAAIEVGGQRNANVLFSTKEIASKAGVAEATLFSRFKSKEKLIYAALSRGTAIRTAEMKRLSESGASLFELVEGLEDYLIRNSSLTTFLLNYGESVAKIGSPSNFFVSFRKQCLIDMHYLDAYIVWPDDEEAQFLIYTTFIRNILYDVQFVLSGFEKWDEDYKRKCAALLLSGLREQKHHA